MNFGPVLDIGGQDGLVEKRALCETTLLNVTRFKVSIFYRVDDRAIICTFQYNQTEIVGRTMIPFEDRSELVFHDGLHGK